MISGVWSDFTVFAKVTNFALFTPLRINYISSWNAICIWITFKGETFFVILIVHVPIYMNNLNKEINISESNSKPSISSRIRVKLLKKEPEKDLLHCITLDEPHLHILVKQAFSSEITDTSKWIENVPNGVQLNLIDCDLDDNGHYKPNFIVLEPDYLIDASAIAECFQEYDVTPLHYFRNRLEEKENRSYLLLGNLANFFLDELVYADDIEAISFNDVFLRSFKQSPFEYTSCEEIRTDTDFRNFMQKAMNQFEQIKRVIRYDFPINGIDIHFCTLEPSFFSEYFGFQGRLDLLYMPPCCKEAKIVELKSGKVPYPAHDPHRIASNHEIQTIVYQMMVEGVFEKENRRIGAAILYSAAERQGENLRFASATDEKKRKIIQLRNLIVAIELGIIYGENSRVAEIFEASLRVGSSQRLPHFYLKKIEKIGSLLMQCSELEKEWFYRYIRFISEELYLQKVGNRNESYAPNGLSSLWNSDFAERHASLDVVSDLTIREIDDTKNERTIIFNRNEADNDIVNFREGEICIVYPRNDVNDTVLNRQILKGTIVQITREEVEVRFRYKQKNRHFFEDHQLWAIEHDCLDSSCNNMYKSIFSFLKASKQKRKLLLGLKPPFSKKLELDDRKSPSQEEIIEKAIHSEDYFLIVGPPGTGKTSIFARRLIEEFYRNPNNNMLVLAYTNRAVDELCDAINAAFGCSNGSCDTYIRIGSELSCAEPFRHRLLQRISEKAPNRESLRSELQQTRIYISTLASIMGKMELFSLKHFHVAIIDEASQILEPQIIGLLPRFDRFIMIGDHNQLSTIVLQSPERSAISESSLRNEGIIDCRDSLFERLLRRCKEKGWHHAYVQLTQQGRMHEEIARFPATYFYSESLFPASDWQSNDWNLNCSSNKVLDHCVATHRTAFLSTEQIKPTANNSDKLNETEAEIIVELLKSMKRVYEENNIPFDTSSIGIIAPFRNQIALIKHKLSESRLHGVDEIMIDTVERFQGSQRDVIILSFCVNNAGQLTYLSNLNHEGTVDRKLNVAITRARQQLFLVGNGHILQQHPIYATLLNFYQDKKIILDNNSDN